MTTTCVFWYVKWCSALSIQYKKNGALIKISSIHWIGKWQVREKNVDKVTSYQNSSNHMIKRLHL